MNKAFRDWCTGVDRTVLQKYIDGDICLVGLAEKIYKAGWIAAKREQP